MWSPLTNKARSATCQPNLSTAMRHERIETNAAIMDGKPVIRGTRVPVDLVLRELDAGMAKEAILVEHKRLTADDIRAAEAFRK